jgi:hypothetical protein
LAPLIELVPDTASAGEDVPDRITALTLVGVIAPRVSVIFGVLVAVATVPETPAFVFIDTLVTVPLPVPLLLKVVQSVLER